MKTFLALFAFLPSVSVAFLGSTDLRCDSKINFTVKSGKEIKNFPPGTHTLKIKDVAVLTVGGAKAIAKLFPQQGLDSVLLKKNGNVMSTDGRTYWGLQSKLDPNISIYCETKDE